MHVLMSALAAYLSSMERKGSDVTPQDLLGVERLLLSTSTRNCVASQFRSSECVAVDVVAALRSPGVVKSEWGERPGLPSATPKQHFRSFDTFHSLTAPSACSEIDSFSIGRHFSQAVANDLR